MADDGPIYFMNITPFINYSSTVHVKGILKTFLDFCAISATESINNKIELKHIYLVIALEHIKDGSLLYDVSTDLT